MRCYYLVLYLLLLRVGLITIAVLNIDKITLFALFIIFRQPKRRNIMPKYVIEREIPGAGKMSPKELQDISKMSNKVIQEMGPDIQWNQSYVTGDKIYCEYIAANKDMVREHAKKGGFPADRISKVRTIIDPTSAD